MYDYGSAEDNMKHYGVVSVCVGRVVESAGCVRRVVVSVCWEGGGEEKCRVYVFTVGKGGEYRVWEVGVECVLGGWWKVQGVCVGRVVESAGCVLGGWWRVQGVCVGRVVESAGCVCWESGGECRVCVGRVVESAGCVLGGWWRVQGVCWKVSGECRVCWKDGGERGSMVYIFVPQHCKW